MPKWRPALDAWFRTHLGVISALQLEALGCDPRTAHRMVQRGELIRVLPGVFRNAAWPDGELQRMAAACARNPAVAIGLTTADRLWGFRKIRDQRVHALVPHGSSPVMDGVTVHRCRRIDPVDIVTRPDGIRLTSPPRSLFDSADMLGVSVTRSVLEQILNERLCTIDTVVDTFVRLAHVNRPGTHTMRAVLASRPRWRSALQSDLELRVLQEIERQLLPAPVTQCPVRLPDGALIHLDFGWPECKVGLEVDDPTWHDGVEDRQRDTRRDRKAAIVGWAVPRVSRLDVEGDLADAIHDIGVLIAARQRAA